VARINGLGKTIRSRLQEIISEEDIDASVLGDGSVFAIRMSRRLPTSFRDQILPVTAQHRALEFFKYMLNAGHCMSPHGLGVLSTAMSENDLAAFLKAAHLAFLATRSLAR
jgi:glutamate-1-semialdehyde aminotransferase